MSVELVDTGEVVSDVEVLGEDYLDDLASTVRREYRRSKEALGDAVDAYFAVGHALLAARRALPSNQAFGAWFVAQEFGFSRQWSHVLQQAADAEPVVRAALSTQVDNGGSPNIKKAVAAVTAGPATKPAEQSKPRRTPIVDSADTAGWELRRAVERIERLLSDDRFPANKQQVATRLRSHLAYAIEALPGLGDAITTDPQEDQ